jgi:hypothetical protein
VNKNIFWGAKGTAQVVECEALGSVLSYAKKKKKILVVINITKREILW